MKYSETMASKKISMNSRYLWVKHFIVIATFFFLLNDNSLQCDGSIMNYYVSVTSGSDDWDGHSADHFPDTNTGPWETIPHAIAEIRKVRTNSPSSEDQVVVNILSGDYFLTETLKLDDRDSYMTIKSLHPNENVKISGGLELSKFYKNEKNFIQSTTFEGSCGEAFAGDKRLIPARSPNHQESSSRVNINIGQGPYHTIKDLLVETSSCTRNSKAYSQNCPDEDRNGFIFENSVYSPDWKDLDHTKILIFHSWIAEFAKVSNITQIGADWKVLFQEPLKHAPVGKYCKSGGWRFLFYNNLALLDEPGEYVCVERGNVAEFSYIPPTEASILRQGIEDDSIIISQLDVLLFLNKVTHMNFEGLIFQHTSSSGEDGYNWGTQNTLKVLSSSDVSFHDCEISHVGMTGLFIQDSNKITISRNVFHDLGYHGVMIEYKYISDNTRDILIENNIFEGCGANTFWQPNCLWVGGYENITVRHNEISYVPYAGLRIHSLMPHNETRDINDPVYRFDFNDFHDYGLGILNDFGAVYISVDNVNCDTISKEDGDELINKCSVYSHVYNNRIRLGLAYDNQAHSLYSDVSSCRNTFENNLMYGQGENALYHHCGLDNLATNNVIHRTSLNADKIGDSARFETVWAGCDTADRQQQYNNTKNIYLLDDINGFHFSRSWDRYYDSSPVFDYNVYWCMAPGDAKSAPLYPDNLNWYQWIESGNDTNSLWQDPLFEDPINHNYVLKEDSPAFSLGISQIDLDQFGVQTGESFKQTIHRNRH